MPHPEMAHYPNGDWKEYKQLVLATISRLEFSLSEVETEARNQMDDIRRSLVLIGRDIAILQTKSLIYGTIGGSIGGALLALIIGYLARHLT